MNQSTPPANKPGESAQHLGSVGLRRPQQPKTAAEALADKWKKHVGSAKIVWAKLSDEELLKTGGQAENLTSLVQERYAISQDAASKRVKNFLAQYKL